MHCLLLGSRTSTFIYRSFSAKAWFTSHSSTASDHEDVRSEDGDAWREFDCITFRGDGAHHMNEDDDATTVGKKAILHIHQNITKSFKSSTQFLALWIL